MKKIYNHGLAKDPRTRSQKKKDFFHEEVAGGVVVEWKEKQPSEWKKYIPREQDGSLSCCGQASAKAVEILNGTIMSAHPIYRSRANYPEGGMYLQNVGDIWKKIGSTTEALDKSQWEGETEMNRPITVDTPTKMGSYFQFQYPKNIDAIAEAIQVHGQCFIIVHCAKSEWIDIPQYNGSSIDFGHCVCAVDFFLHNGTKVLLIEDSTGHFNSLDKNGQRLITEDFVNKRIEGAMYLVLAGVPIPTPSHHVFYKLLKYGMVDQEVFFLQDYLKSKGFFPSSVASTGNFFSVTKKAVMDFQAANGLQADGIVGPKTNEKLNS